MTPRRALAWSFAERYASITLTLGSTLILARLITPQQLGVYSVCAAFTAMAGIWRDFGVSEYLIQEKDLTRDKLRAACSIALLVAWPLAAALYVGRQPLAQFFAEPGVAEVLAVLSLHFVLLPITSPAFALLNREMAFHRIFALQLTSQVVAVSTSLLLAWRGFGYMALAWGPVAGVATQTLLLILLRPADSLLLPGLRQARSVLRFGLMYVTSRGVETLARHVHEPIIAKTFDFASVGIFSRAWGLIELFNTHVADAIVRVTTPAFASESRAGKPPADSYARATAIFVCVAWSFFGFVALTAPEIVAVLFGDQWGAAAPIATVLALAAIPTSLVELAPQMLSATGHVHLRLRASLWVSALHVLGVVVAAQVGLLAVAAVSLFSGLCMVLLCARNLKVAYGMHAMVWLRPCGRSALVAAGSVAGQAVAVYGCRAVQVHPLLLLGLAAAVGTGTWLAVAWALNHPAYAELRVLWASARRRTKVEPAVPR